mmetsp:Transcript_67103/g.189758  ORF Transcript_67103/g.189758 Transcript_67103/m.189758 type:complete len:273 (+) Transcript_67103:1257-2075(+)
MARTSLSTPKVFASRACSRVCPPRSKPVSNSPLRAEMMSTPTSAWDAPLIMFGTYDLWPGASSTVKRRFGVSKAARPTSTVLPLAFSSSLVSMMYAKNQLSRFFSLASFMYFSTCLSSTQPHKKRMLPHVVDFPASTWPMNTTFKCGLGSGILISPSALGRTASSSPSSSSAAAGLAAGAAAAGFAAGAGAGAGAAARGAGETAAWGAAASSSSSASHESGTLLVCAPPNSAGPLDNAALTYSAQLYAHPSPGSHCWETSCRKRFVSSSPPT